MPDVRIETVKVIGRYRKDLGDLQSLAQSIARIGLINAITITPDGQLIAGQRRLEACRSLGWKVIGARVVDNLEDAAARLLAERDENTERKAMTYTELVTLGRSLEDLERPRAAARQAQAPGQPQGQKVSSGRGTGTEEKGETREVVGRALGMSGTTYQRAKAVVGAAEAPDATPTTKAIRDEMERTGNVAAAHEKLRGSRPPALTPPAKTVIQGAIAQRRAISVANTTLSGVCHGLKQIEELHPGITSEEAAEWVDGLSESRAVIERLIKRLKERSNERS